MSKKDRIAIVVSILYLLFPLLVLMVFGSDGPIMAVIFSSPLLVYWGYRFIKNDISFLKIGKKDEE